MSAEEGKSTKVQFSLWESRPIHKNLKDAYLQARKLTEQLHDLQHNAQQIRFSLYQSLVHLEREIQTAYEANGIRDHSDLITIKDDYDEDEGPFSQGHWL